MRRKTTEEFVNEANKIHNGKYDYSKVNYIDSNTKVCIICPIHGEFWQTPINHLCGKGCRECGIENIKKKQRLTVEEFVEKATKKHKGKYDYSKVEYVNNHTKVCIICSEHGEFWQTPNDHLTGYGCPKCGGTCKLNTEMFITKAKSMHKEKYDYSKVVYVDAKTKVCISCPEHGEFWQVPYSHLQGSGCPKCQSSHMENLIRNLLSENKIEFDEQKRFSWLGLQSLDFYLPKQNIAIECQGIQHFKSHSFFTKRDTFKLIKMRDEKKRNLCKNNGIDIIYFANYDFDFPYKVVKNENDLISLLKKYELK